MKGISPVISVTLLIALAIIMAVTTYYWVAGLNIEPPEKQDDPIDIDATIANASAGTIVITNEIKIPKKVTCQSPNHNLAIRVQRTIERTLHITTFFTNLKF